MLNKMKRDRHEIKEILKKVNSLMQPSGDHVSTEHIPSAIGEQIHEQRKLLKELTLWCKASEDKRRDVEEKNKILLTENKKLNTLLNAEHQNLIQTQENIASLQEQNKNLTKIMEESVSKEKNRTEEGTQTEIKIPERPYSFTKDELYQVEEDMQEVKRLLASRENRWNKIAEREYEQRVIIQKINGELEDRRNELKTKNEAFNKLAAELEKTKKGVFTLRRHISRLENKEREHSYISGTIGNQEAPQPPNRRPRSALPSTKFCKIKSLSAPSSWNDLNL